MSTLGGPNSVRGGLVLHLDAANSKSYPGTGVVWNDLSRNGNSGTLINGPSFDSGNGGSIVFDGTDDYVSLPNDLNYTSEFSAFSWFKSLGSPLGGYHIIFGGLQLELSVPEYGQIRTGVVTNTRFVSNHGGGLTDGNWHNIGFTFNGSVKESYIDGVSVGTQSVTGVLINTFPNRTIGRYGSNYFLNGQLNDLKIYNRALSGTEILQNYNATKSRFGL